MLEWKEPPPRRNGRGLPDLGQRQAAELRQHPMEWARLSTDHPNHDAANQVAMRIRRGHKVAFRPAGTFEARAVDCDVFARYVGDPSIPDEVDAVQP